MAIRKNSLGFMFGLAVTVCATSYLQAMPQGQVYTSTVSPGFSYSNKLGIRYQLVPYGQGYGAKLVAPPVAGSPLQQIGLEANDMIYALDGQIIRGPADIENHTDQTQVDFINIRTNAPQTGFVFIPQAPPVAPPIGPPVVNAYRLGILSVPVTLPQGFPAFPGGPATPAQSGLQITSIAPGSAAAVAGLKVGDVLLDANGQRMWDNNALLNTLAQCQGILRMTVRDRDYASPYRTVIAYPQAMGAAAAAAAPVVAPAP